MESPKSDEFTERLDSWINQFEIALASDPGACKAWKRLERAGLRKGAQILLYGYAGGADEDLRLMHGGAANSARLIKADVRAQKLARTSQPKRAHDPDLFRRRATEAHQAAMGSEWPMRAGDVSTLGDELARVRKKKGTDPPLAAVRKALVKAAGKRSPVNRMYLLMLLQGYAAKYGVQLGVKRLGALASCSLPGYPDEMLDEGTLGRYLRKTPQHVKDSILSDALRNPNLPPPDPPKAKR